MSVHDPVLDAIGRCGALSYVFERQGARTVLAQSSCSSPWHYFPPSVLDDSGCAYTWLVNPSGGLVGGDQVTVAAHLRAGTHVLMTSPSANRATAFASGVTFSARAMMTSRSIRYGNWWISPEGSGRKSITRSARPSVSEIGRAHV